MTEIDPDEFGAGDACDCIAYLALAARFLEDLKARGNGRAESTNRLASGTSTPSRTSRFTLAP